CTFLFLAICIFLPTFLEGQTATVRGKVTDNNNNFVELANVAILGEKGGTSTDKHGKFELQVPANKKFTLAVTFVGFAEKRIVLNLDQDQIKVIDIQVQPISTNLPGFEVKDENLRMESMVRLSPRDAQVAPSLSSGVTDMIKTLPGVSSNNEMSSQYSVRGGNFDENLIFVNDIEIYRPFLVNSGQQEGLSFVNSSLVSSILFSAGGFGAEYGDKLSSVLDIKYKKPTEFAGSFSASLLGAELSLGGITPNQKFTYLVGARYKTNSYLLNSLQTKGEYQPVFADIQSLFTYKISDKWDISLLGYYSDNKYKVVPANRETDFGTWQEVYRFKVYFDGNEVDKYTMFQGGLTFGYKPNKLTDLRLIISAFNTVETERYDIQGQYWIGQVSTDNADSEYGDVVQTQGVGTYLLHARNAFEATVATIEHKGTHLFDQHQVKWGVRYQNQVIDDQLREWEMVDSADYSLPHHEDTPGNPTPDNPNFELKDFVKGHNKLNTNRYAAYISDQWKFIMKNKDEISLTGGIRANYWDYNNEFLVAPRISFAFKPVKRPNIVFRFATGYYYQPAFYREMRDMDGTLNPDIKAQESIHFILGNDYRFKAWNRPFILTTELYYKLLDNLVPYTIENVRIRYLANERAKGYATGIDLKLYGEFVKGLDSWISLSVMQTREDVYGDYYYNYYNTDSELIKPGSTNTQVMDSVQIFPGYIPRPADQRVNLSIFFQDYIPKYPFLKVYVRLLFGTGLPFGPPDSERYQQTGRMPAYRRVDMGFSYQIINEGTTFKPKSPFRGIKNMWLNLEVFNILDIYNTVSYIWIKDISNREYAVPNYLTPRLVNLKLTVEF
ncbi:MAG: carboxypeptidase-like regulatory domain-containing protein, partial [Bacteroidales bacterium]